MRQFEYLRKFSASVEALFKNFAKKSPVYIALSGLVGFCILVLGVGGTLAANGLIANPFASSSSTEQTEGTSSLEERTTGDGSLPTDSSEWGPVVCDSEPESEAHKLCIDEIARRGNALLASGWTGVLYNFNDNGFYSEMLIDVSYPSDVTMKLEINSRLAGSVTIQDCKPTSSDDRGFCSNMLNIALGKSFNRESFAICQPAGDTYVVEVSGGGYFFRESGIIPTEVFDCPTVEPSIFTTPDSSSEPETSPDPGSSSEPETSPTPTP